MDSRMKASLAVAVSATRSHCAGQTQEELRLAVAIWTERTYHRRRRQRALRKLTPVAFQTVHEVPYAA